MLHNIRNGIVIIVVGSHKIRRRLYHGQRVLHRHADARAADHVQIIVLISGSDDAFSRNVQQFRQTR